MKNENHKKTGILALAFILPALMTLVFFGICRFYPFGEDTVLTGDLRQQFISYFAYFKSVFTTKNDFLYTFSKTIGGDMPGLSAYYLQNPLLLLLFLFPGRHIAEGVAYLFLLQVSLAGLSCSYFLNKRYGWSFSSLLFSTAYAFCGFFFNYQVVVIYFSCLCLLPLVLLLFFDVIEQGRNKTGFILSAALYIFMNYYMGYMLMIFLCICYIGKVISDTSVLKHFKELVICIITAVLLDGISLVPAVLSLRGEKSSASADFGFYRKFSMLQVFNGFFSGSTRNALLPVIYSSVFVLLLVAAFFISRRFALREKLSVLFVLTALFVSMWINTIDAVWHGFNNPVGFPFRYSYLVSFTMCAAAYRCFKEKVGRALFISSVSVLIYLCFLHFTGSPYIDRDRFIINAVIIVLLCILSSLVRYGKIRLLALMLLFAVSLSDMVYNAYVVYTHNNSEEERNAGVASFYEAWEETGAAVDKIKEKDKGFYRIEKTFQYSPNDAMLLGYMGLSHSSSCEKDHVRHLMQDMGFRDTGLYAFYDGGSTAFADAFFGIKYLISEIPGTVKPYEMTDGTGKYSIFENPYCMPLAQMCSDRIKDTEVIKGDPFAFQNAVASAMIPDADDNGMTPVKEIYEKADIKSITLEGVSQEGNIYRKDPDSDGFIIYEIEVKDDRPLYFYFDAPHLQSGEVFVNDASMGWYFTETHWTALCAGRFDAGETVRIKLQLLKEELEVDKACFYYEDEEALADWRERLAAVNNGTGQIEEISSSHLRLKVKPEETSLLLFTFPYEKGWNIKVDGKKTSGVPVLGTLMGLELAKGEHSIELRYIPEGMIPGLFMSVIGVLLLCFGGRGSEKNYARSINNGA